MRAVIRYSLFGSRTRRITALYAEMYDMKVSVFPNCISSLSRGPSEISRKKRDIMELALREKAMVDGLNWLWKVAGG
jgi:hypothetical protein